MRLVKATSTKSGWQSAGPVEAFNANFKQIHWGMRLMSLLSLLTLGLYSYVLRLCQKEARRNARFRQLGQLALPLPESRRVRLASLAFGLDLLVSAYFSAITPVLLKQGGVAFNRQTLPRPLFWFFAVTGFVPTASMTFTVLTGRRWTARIQQKKVWRVAHGLVALLAYFSWWLACAPVFLVAVLGERRTMALLKALSREQ